MDAAGEARFGSAGVSAGVGLCPGRPVVAVTGSSSGKPA